MQLQCSCPISPNMGYLMLAHTGCRLRYPINCQSTNNSKYDLNLINMPSSTQKQGPLCIHRPVHDVLFAVHFESSGNASFEVLYIALFTNAKKSLNQI